MNKGKASEQQTDYAARCLGGFPFRRSVKPPLYCKDRSEILDAKNWAFQY